MLFLIFLILTLIFCFSAYFLNENDYDGASTITGVLGTITGIITVIMILILAITWVNIPSTEAKWHQQYKDLNYQIIVLQLFQIHLQLIKEILLLL